MGDRALLESPPHRRYFVVVTAGEHRWWDRFLATGKTHCVLLIWDEFVWLVVNPTLGITEVHMVAPPGGQFTDPLNWLEDPDASVYEADLQYDEGMRAPWVWSPITCVEVIKSCLGIRAFWLWTPRQLERYLIARPRNEYRLPTETAHEQASESESEPGSLSDVEARPHAGG